jgi:hypothetical protein
VAENKSYVFPVMVVLFFAVGVLLGAWCLNHFERGRMRIVLKPDQNRQCAYSIEYGRYNAEQGDASRVLKCGQSAMLPYDSGVIGCGC